MKISPMPSANVPTVDMHGNPAPSRVDAVRSLRMKTNMTSTSIDDLPPELRPERADAGQLPDSDNAAAEATQPLSPQLALLAKQRRALQVKERELADREKALTAQGQTPRVDVARLKSEPLSVLREAGVTYEQLTEAILADGRGDSSDLNAIKAEIAALKEGVDKRFVDNDTKAEQQVLAEMEREANRLVATSDEFELVREMRRVPVVKQLIEQTYRKTGEVLDVSEALRLVEAELFKDAQKIAGYKKLQQFMAPQPQTQPQQRTMGMRTLTNRDTATVPLTAKQRAMAAFHGTLRKG